MKWCVDVFFHPPIPATREPGWVGFQEDLQIDWRVGADWFEAERFVGCGFSRIFHTTIWEKKCWVTLFQASNEKIQIWDGAKDDFMDMANLNCSPLI